MKRILSAGLATFILLIFSCSAKQNDPTPATATTTTTGYTPPAVSTSFVKGADISWVTQMEASGLKFYDKNGNPQDLFVLMKSLGMNAIRLRAWVNPADGWCNTADVLAKAQRAKNAGMKILLDFHYSDVWADPGHQTKPAAWAQLSFTNMVAALSTYTVNTLTTLKNAGIVPDWVQVGNETNDGMLWEDGRASTNMANFAALVKAGYSAVKSVDPTSKVIVHISNGYDNALFRWMFDGLKANGAQWDIIGMSLYPTTSNWQTLDTQCQTNMTDMIARYNTQVMIVEVGMDVNSPQTCRDFLTDIITKTNGIANGNGLGVLYWEPEAYNWNSYSLGAFDNTNRPTIALDAFGN
jgi:arabinogalactan endo-1,4-beta-galactosidase